MRAAVWTRLGHVEIQEVPTPTPKAGEVLLKVMAAGLCATDLHVMTGAFAYGAPPHILGHEIAGEVVALGPGTQGARIGDRAAVETSIGCGRCAACLSGNRHLCAALTEIGFTPHDGGYAQYVAVPAANLVALPDGVSYDEAGILEAVVCPVGALVRLGVRFGETAVVYGVGPAGIAFIQGAKAMGAKSVIAVGRNAQRLQRAMAFGADAVVNTAEQDALEAIRDLTEGRGADLVMEAAGVPETIRLALQSARKAGRIILYGLPPDGADLPFPVKDIVMNQLEVYGAVGNPFVWKPLLDMVARGAIDLRNMVTHTYPLADVPRAFADLADNRMGICKAVIHPWAETDREEEP